MADDTRTPADPEMLGAALLGYHRAVIRFGEDLKALTPGQEGFGALTSATEALYWACSLGEQLFHCDPTYKEQADGYGQKMILGARWARNRATHELAFVVTEAEGRQYPQPDPQTGFEVVWRPDDQLPSPGKSNADQQTAYDLYFASKPVRRTWGAISQFFASEQNRPGSLLSQMTADGIGRPTQNDIPGNEVESAP
ncbi:hypothetical protein OOK58_43315 [Streptomyces sp. NBC_01728]|uniref:hypothetical protein n=1 Tax=unclassified Streptomyces TaxID=2593676 RepID=UPI00224F8C6A|nr:MULTISPECIES: hypothetical protein [unclassified Streptomyces]MCX4458742.1 hypothetical protein [Streptomyces sp. NBC_01719]MCX4498099.1 hypothetical protein [Streptomyces sp. NBC_01728]